MKTIQSFEAEIIKILQATLREDCIKHQDSDLAASIGFMDDERWAAIAQPLAEFVKAAVTAEREACANICDERADDWSERGGDEGEYGWRGAQEAEEEIRARATGGA